jgi:HSP20 family protein
MARELGRLINELLGASAGDLQHAPWRPAADVYRTADGWLVKLELAGVRPDEIQLSAQGRRLLIEGRRRDSIIQESGECYSLEISYSRFERSIDFPCSLNQARILTDYQNGMLVVRIVTACPESQAGEHRS